MWYMVEASDVKELKCKGRFSFLMIDHIEAEGKSCVCVWGSSSGSCLWNTSLCPKQCKALALAWLTFCHIYAFEPICRLQMPSSPTLDILRINLSLSKPQESECSEHLMGWGRWREKNLRWTQGLADFSAALNDCQWEASKVICANDRGQRTRCNACHNYPESPCCTFDACDPLCGFFKQPMMKLIYAYIYSSCIKTIIKNKKCTHTEAEWSWKRDGGA